MGYVTGVSHDRFPTQGQSLGRRVEVVFHFDVGHTLLGTVVRDDTSEPYQGVIRLDDGRHVLMSECQYRTALESNPGAVRGQSSTSGEPEQDQQPKP